MYSRWYNVTIVVFWLATMGWLVTQKILPPMLPGQPPSLPAILEAQQTQPPVGWDLILDERPLGWALSTTVPLADGNTEYRSRLHIDRLPLKQMTSGWLRALTQFPILSRVIGSSLVLLPIASKLQMDARSTMTIDPSGHLLSVYSTLRMDPVGELVRIHGTVKGTSLLASLTWGDAPESDAYLKEIPLGSLLGDEFSPRTQLPGLYDGQSWTEPSYNPMQFHNPIEILHSTVEGTDFIEWNGQMEEVWLVVYRNDSGFRMGGDRSVHARLWVRPDGTVLKQEANMFDSSMVFIRLPEAEAIEKLRIEADKPK
jgi:hypothetical protein